jgi:hypothetical protein
MRLALRNRANVRQQIAETKSIPAPVAGWNSRDALQAMKINEAVWLDNWFPAGAWCELRGGHSSHATGMTGIGKTLATYNNINGTNQMFCTTQSGTYNVSSAGAVGASLAARTSGKHQYINFGDGTSNWLIMVNGVDKPLYYDGATWTAVDAVSTPALTGLTTTDIIHVFASKGRLFFIQRNSLSFWYLTAGAAGGALTEFDLSGVATMGGYLMAGETWTIDAGDGPDDRVVFVTSEGEALVYAGTNPNSATTWALVGRYVIGRPLGRRCIEKYGGDLLILNENGAFPMSAAVQSATIDYKMALSFKIEPTFNESARLYGDNFGWCAELLPERSALIINVPVAEDGIHYQYVMNTITKAWCRFIGWNAEDFVNFNKELYFVKGGVVYKAWSGQSDIGANIEAYGKTAFNYFSSPNQQKRFTMFRPVLSVNGDISFKTDYDVDFADDPIIGTATYNVANNSLWDAAIWDTSLWGAGPEIVRKWTSPSGGIGYCASAKIKIATNSLQIKWFSNDIVFERGGVL